MATYPVINKQTGEQKEVTLSVHDWDQWKQIIQNGKEIGLTHQLVPLLVKLVKFMID